MGGPQWGFWEKKKKKKKKVLLHFLCFWSGIVWFWFEKSSLASFYLLLLRSQKEQL